MGAGVNTEARTRGRKALAGVLLVLGLVSCAGLPDHVGPERLYWRAPVLLPGVTPDLRRPGFWVGHLADPDGLVMDPAQIAALNQNLVDRRLVQAVPRPEGVEPASGVRDRLTKDFAWFAKQTYYLPDGRKVDPTWWAAVRTQLNLDDPQADTDRWALAVAFTDQRILPDRTRLTAEVLDSDFDEMQNSAYDLGTPFQVVHESRDHRWVWARGSLSDGWLDPRTLAYTDRQTLVDWQARETVVMTAARAEVWGDRDRHQWKTWLRMGARLPVEADEGELWRVTLPTAGPEGTLVPVSAWIAKADAARGSLPYTRRTVLEQAFKLLDRPYGWGDSYGEQDCSRFIAEVFSTVGIVLPRNSAAQGASGVALAAFQRSDPAAAKAAAVASADPATTLLRLDGHIMLYLGSLEGVPYAIHETWAYTQMDQGRPVIRVMNGVVVSTLELSAGSPRGSLLERIRSIRELQPLPPPAPTP